MNALLRYARLAAAALFTSAMLCGVASAQNEWPTPTVGKTVVGVGNLCLNSSGQMVPMFSAAGAYQCAGTGVPGTVKPASLISAGAQQNNLAISTNTQLTVPAGTIAAYVTVEGANVRRTSDGTSATTANGTLLQAGSQWMDTGPLAAYKFTAVSGSPTITVEYFK